MSVWVFPSFLSAGSALALAAILFFKRKDGPAFAPLILVMAVLAWIHGLNGMSDVFQGNPLLWKKLILLGEVTLPVMVGYVSYSLLQNFSSNPEALGSGWWRIIVGGAVILGVLVMGAPDGFMQINFEGEIVFKRAEGLTLWGFILFASFISVLRLEQILRFFRDPLRYQL
ncbi:MAG: hypothetical protein OEV70_15420, partial [Nitrospirota bacterium]|nr:hypothetical protein [Nitrospirota bacterium]